MSTWFLNRTGRTTCAITFLNEHRRIESILGREVHTYYWGNSEPLTRDEAIQIKLQDFQLFRVEKR